jgi:hypothetical protein
MSAADRSCGLGAGAPGSRHLPDRRGSGEAANVEAAGWRRREMVLRRMRFGDLRLEPQPPPSRSASGWARSTTIPAFVRRCASLWPTPWYGNRSPMTAYQGSPKAVTLLARVHSNGTEGSRGVARAETGDTPLVLAPSAPPERRWYPVRQHCAGTGSPRMERLWSLPVADGGNPVANPTTAKRLDQAR